MSGEKERERHIVEKKPNTIQISGQTKFITRW
jgi:hypothetical protein